MPASANSGMIFIGVLHNSRDSPIEYTLFQPTSQ